MLVWIIRTDEWVDFAQLHFTFLDILHRVCCQCCFPINSNEGTQNGKMSISACDYMIWLSTDCRSISSDWKTFVSSVYAECHQDYFPGCWIILREVYFLNFGMTYLFENCIMNVTMLKSHFLLNLMYQQLQKCKNIDYSVSLEIKSWQHFHRIF